MSLYVIFILFVSSKSVRNLSVICISYRTVQIMIFEFATLTTAVFQIMFVTGLSGQKITKQVSARHERLIIFKM